MALCFSRCALKENVRKADDFRKNAFEDLPASVIPLEKKNDRPVMNLVFVRFP